MNDDERYLERLYQTHRFTLACTINGFLCFLYKVGHASSMQHIRSYHLETSHAIYIKRKAHRLYKERVWQMLRDDRKNKR